MIASQRVGLAFAALAASFAPGAVWFWQGGGHYHGVLVAGELQVWHSGAVMSIGCAACLAAAWLHRRQGRAIGAVVSTWHGVAAGLPALAIAQFVYRHSWIAPMSRYHGVPGHEPIYAQIPTWAVAAVAAALVTAWIAIARQLITRSTGRSPDRL